MRVILLIIWMFLWMYIPTVIGMEKSLLFSIIRFLFVVLGAFAIMYACKKKE